MNKKEVAEMAELKQQVKDIDEKLDTHTKEQREDFKILFKKIDSMHHKFAGKWVEKMIAGIIVGAIVGIIVLIASNGG